MSSLETQFEGQNRASRTRPVITNEHVVVAPPIMEPRRSYTPDHNHNAPYFESRDIVAGALGAAMMLGPLLATTLGYGG